MGSDTYLGVGLYTKCHYNRVRKLGPDYFRPRSIKDRLNVAKEFLELGKQEIQQGRSRGEIVRIREGSEKVFHALVEACAARIQKYGLSAPQSHDAIRIGLETANEKELKKTYEDAFHRLHGGVYYKGWIDFGVIEEQVTKIEEAIKHIEKRTRR